MSYRTLQAHERQLVHQLSFVILIGRFQISSLTAYVQTPRHSTKYGEVRPVLVNKLTDELEL